MCAVLLCAAPTIKHELALTKLQLEAEKERGRLREQTIAILKSDKEYLQREMISKDEKMRELLKTGNRSMEPSSSSGDQLYARLCCSLVIPFHFTHKMNFDTHHLGLFCSVSFNL